MTNRKNRKMLMVCLIASIATTAYSEPTIEMSRGELLYSTHCIACHTTKVHWRDKRLVTDWQSLNNQVRRWQESISLNWNADDVAVVSSYLNAVYYHLPTDNVKEVAQKKNRKIAR